VTTATVSHSEHRTRQWRRFDKKLPPRTGPYDRADRDTVLAVLGELRQYANLPSDQKPRPAKGAARILDWLLAHPGDGWQARWIASGAEADLDWLSRVSPSDTRSEQARRRDASHGLYFLFLARIILPSYDFLAEVYDSNHRLFPAIRRAWGPSGLQGRLDAVAEACGMHHGQKDAGLRIITKIMVHTGRDIGELTADDFHEYREWRYQARGHGEAGQWAAWDLLRGIGVIPAERALRDELHPGPQPTAALVDFYGVQNPEIRAVLIRYLDERRPHLDYSTFRNLAAQLAGLFWADIEAHHPEIGTLHLPTEVAEAWKQRMAFRKSVANGSRCPRKAVIEALTNVRAFYLDIQEWAQEDPSWVPWAAPSPVRKADTAGQAKRKRAQQSWSHQRIRERLPHLPLLVANTERHRDDQAELLAKVTAASVGDLIEHGGRTYRRVISQTAARDPDRCPPPQAWVEDADTSERVDVAWAEDDAFWTWAVIETFRHTGIRVEELMEITHLALISYRLPDTGELVPMLQIVPSKVNEERLLLVSPELASVLATVISRLRAANDGTVPRVARYDPHERVTGPPLPHLFQRKTGHGWRSQVFSYGLINRMLNDALTRTGLCDNAGQPLRYTAHDFRRLFATDAVTAGLPVHIAARVLGHHNLSTTQSYLNSRELHQTGEKLQVTRSAWWGSGASNSGVAAA
jgi:integrase